MLSCKGLLSFLPCKFLKTPANRLRIEFREECTAQFALGMAFAVAALLNLALILMRERADELFLLVLSNGHSHLRFDGKNFLWLLSGSHYWAGDDFSPQWPGTATVPHLPPSGTLTR